MNRQDQILDNEIDFRIKKIKEIYQDFLKEIEALKTKKNKIINQTLARVDQKKIQDILDKLKK
jgi:hypothetical protein